MKKIEDVFKKLSELYEFNKNLKTFTIQTRVKGQKNTHLDRENDGGAVAATARGTAG